MKPRIIKDLPFSDYVQLDGINASKLKNVITCKTLCHANYENTKAYESSVKLGGHFETGQLLHTMLLEPDKLDQFVIFDRQLRKNEDKEAFAEIVSSGKTPIKSEQQYKANRMAKAVSAKPDWQVGSPELTLQWVDEETGLLCKCRIDNLTDDIIWDLKTEDPKKIQTIDRSMLVYGYHIQAAHYQAGVKAAFGKELPFKFMFAESDEPFQAVHYELDDMSMEVGRRERMKALLAFKESNWPGYQDGFISLPEWKLNEYFGV